MKYVEFINEAKLEGKVLVARCSSGRYFTGETAQLTSFNDNYAYLKTENGNRVRVNNVYGRATVGSKKYKDCFVVSVERMDDPNFIKGGVL